MRDIALGLIIALVAQVAWGQSQGENILRIRPAGYKIDYEDRQGDRFLVEMVPLDESVNNWTEMVSIQIFFGNKSMTPRQFYHWMQERSRKSCKDSEVSSVVEDSEDGYDFARFVWHCPLNPSTGKLERTFYKAIKGNEHFYIVTKAFKFDPSEDQIAKWDEYLRSVKVCDTRKSNRACTILERVTLRDGKIYEVEAANGVAIPFASDEIMVLDIGNTLSLDPKQPNAQPWIWGFLAKLKEPGRFAVTVTSPLDDSASATFEVNGPGPIELHFFPKTDYPLVWEGIDQDGSHWFPFRFVFKEIESKKRFEFTQWSQMEGFVWKAMQAHIEKWKRQQLQKQGNQ